MFGNHIGYTTIPASTLVTLIGTFEDNPDYYCTPGVFSFVPQPDNKYIASYEPSKTKSTSFFSNPICTPKIFNITQHKSVSVILRKYKSGFSHGKCVDSYAAN
ncbi:MAG: hypothetical protein COY58_07635 [Gammaproteobacteria bacterium CG_4_10_14_0_8_um_filter_38_16]|nr:MAG: hypothetical protein COY58_07635 [Gammaproteobacteria bacterium CG_4_10_14_0_8_um_filter_38_16]PJA02863.1 MAG: hypothetical protein COX72_08155 [Gammaproteobacteria bacterium CG_4_10_14_0_2_um_filter_38_22]PJB09988.1 MAG: hypothetical protein CO120_07205 [Gammaproteobacteria bacterium CG_4_9_14_3_um_filter_38_9]